MDKKEFTQRLSLIDSIRQQTPAIKEELTTKINSLPNTINALLSAIASRDASFKNYLEDIDRFNFVDNSTILSDVFPGLRTALDMDDPEELLKKTEEMKDGALTITTEGKKIEAFKSNSLSELKKSLSLLIEYLKQEEQIYDLEIDLLKDLDSPYDVGQLASSTR